MTQLPSRSETIGWRGVRLSPVITATGRPADSLAFDTTLRHTTLLYVAQPVAFPSILQTLKCVAIGGQTYFEAAKIVRALRISRQTLWLWRKNELIPMGSKHRNRLVFSEDETAQIIAYAARVEPVALRDSRAQMKLRLA